MTEGRELFWDSFASGKLFARRQTFWDSLWIIMGSRERDWLGMLLNLMFQVSEREGMGGRAGQGGVTSGRWRAREW